MIQGIKWLGWILLAILVLCVIAGVGIAIVIVIGLIVVIAIVFLVAGLLKHMFSPEDDNKDPEQPL